jgi:hypothetical protein
VHLRQFDAVQSINPELTKKTLEARRLPAEGANESFND